VVRLRRIRSGVVGIAFLGSVLLMLSAVALAQERGLSGKVRSGDEVVVPAGETVVHDLYAAGGSVRVEGRVEGDLVAVGSEVDVAGSVTGDVLAAGGATTISGDVGGDVRAAAGQVMVRGSVGEDLVVGAGRATVASGARVGQDFIFGTGRTTLDGTVAGDVLGSTGDYVKRGTVAGDEQVSVEAPQERPPTLGERVLERLRRYISLLAVGALLLWLAPRALRAAADLVRQRPLPSLGAGVLAIVGFGALAFAVILVTVLASIVLGLLGLGLLTGTALFAGLLAGGVLGFVFLVAVAFGAEAVVGLILGRLLLPQDSQDLPQGAPQGTRSFGGDFSALAIGLLIVVAVTSIPLLGGFLEFVAVLLGLGALILALRSRLRRPPPVMAAQPVS
jgi:hypothetical protein